MMHEPLLCGMAQTALDRPAPLLRPGNTNCGGCGMSNLLQMMRRAVSDRPVQLVIPACCAAVGAGSFPQSAYGAATLLTMRDRARAGLAGPDALRLHLRHHAPW